MMTMFMQLSTDRKWKDVKAGVMMDDLHVSDGSALQRSLSEQK